MLRFVEAILTKGISVGDASTTEFYNLACIYSLMLGRMKNGELIEGVTAGELEQKCIDQLTKAIDNGFKDVNLAKTDPNLEGIRNTSQFQELFGITE
jgi:hypothetical protein